MRPWSFTVWAVDTPLAKHARTAVRNGFAVVFLRPGGKEPLCPLTSRELKRAGPHHRCGVSHASSDERWVLRKAKHLAEIHEHINLGIAAHASGVVVIDADGPEQSETVSELLRQLGEDAAVLAGQPTVLTPGKQRSGGWVHERGTHWYFNRPDDLDLPQYPGELVLPGGAVMRWGNSYTVVPPSERAEGPYVSLTDEIADVPAGLVAMIRAHVETRTQRTVDVAERFANDDIAQWACRTPWHTLLEPDGWEWVGKFDRQCGCPVWKRPGEDTSTDRSAIAHEDDCVRLPNLEGHGALYVFSDNPPGLLAERVADGQRTFTKLQYVALARHDGDEAAARVALGIDPDYSQLWDGSGPADGTGDPYTPGGGQERQNPHADTSEQEEYLPNDSDRDPSDRHPLSVLAERLSERTGVSNAQAKKAVGDEWVRREAKVVLDGYLGAEAGTGSSTWMPRGIEQMRSALHRDRSERLEGILERSDGATLFPVGKLHELFGQSSSGKTLLMMVAMLQQVMTGHRVLYCDFEDTLETFLDRYAVDLGIDIEPFIDAGLLCYANPTEPPADLTPLMSMGFRLVVIDSLSEVVAAINDGSLRDGSLIRRVMGGLRQLALSGPAVVVIAHGSEKVDVPSSSLGASEIRQALTGQDVLLLERRPFDARTAGHSLIYIAKDRGSHAGGDTDIDERAANKVQRRLWGMMTVTPTPPDGLEHAGWYTTIEIEPARHADLEPPKEREIDRCERLVIAYLRERPEQSARQIDMTDDIADEHDASERTLRRAIRRLIEDGMAHEIAQHTSSTGRPSPVIKLGPAPEEAQ